MTASAPPFQKASDPDWVEVAVLLRPQGRHGELLAEPAASLDLFIPGRHFAVSPAPSPAAEPVTVELLALWQPTGRNAGRLVLKLRGADSIDAAEALAGKRLFLRSSDLPAPEEGTYRVRDLLGCTLFAGADPVGTVVDVEYPMAADGRTRLGDAPDLLAVQPLAASAGTTADPAPGVSAGEPVLVPFVRAWLEEVDLASQTIRMRLPPGLLPGGEA